MQNDAIQVEELKDTGSNSYQRDAYDSSYGQVGNGTANFPAVVTKTETMINILQTPATKLSQD